MIVGATSTSERGSWLTMPGSTPAPHRMHGTVISGKESREVLDGVRGTPAADIDRFCEAAARFSSMVHALGETLHEIDLNPAIVTCDRCTVVDALVVGAQRGE